MGWTLPICMFPGSNGTESSFFLMFGWHPAEECPTYFNNSNKYYEMNKRKIILEELHKLWKHPHSTSKYAVSTPSHTPLHSTHGPPPTKGACSNFFLGKYAGLLPLPHYYPTFWCKLVNITFFPQIWCSIVSADIKTACLDACTIFCFAIPDKFISKYSRMRNLHFR